jgi:hypothetical protein
MNKNKLKDLFSLKDRYLKFRSVLSRLILKEKNQYYANKVNNVEGDPKKTWAVINDIINKKGKSHNTISEIRVDDEIYASCSEPEEMANKFVEHFSTVGSKLASKIKSTNHNKITNSRSEVYTLSHLVFFSTLSQKMK